MVHFKRLISLSTLRRTTVLLGALYSQAFASGFQLANEYSTTEVSLAGAGGAAYAQDATTNFSNPAGLVNLKNPEFVLGATVISTGADFSGSACGGIEGGFATSPFGTIPINACQLTRTSENGGTNNVVPEFHYAMPFNDRWYGGISLTAPFGLATYYDSDTPLRYQATNSKIQTININPNIAFKFSEQFSVGAGIDAQQMSATLNSHSNLMPNSTVLAQGKSPIVGPVTVTQHYSDSAIRNNADDWGWGWDIGGLYQFSPGSRVGLSYRSAVQYDLTGTSKYTGGVGTRTTTTILGPSSITQPYPTFKTDTSAKVKVPATTTLSLYQELTAQWALMSSLYYTQWNSVQNLTLKNVAFINTASSQLIQPNQAVDVTYPENFRNTWRYALGSEYKFNNELTFRIGGAFDQSPVNSTDRTIRLPDSNRWEGALGAGYRINQYLKLDAGYMHIWFQDAPINQPSNPSVPHLSAAVGSVDASANLYSLQATVDIV